MADAVANKSSYTSGKTTKWAKTAVFTRGGAVTQGSKNAYIVSEVSVDSEIHAYLTGVAGVTDSKHSYLRGKLSIEVEWLTIGTPDLADTTVDSSVHIYLNGVNSSTGSKSAYLYGGQVGSDSKYAFTYGCPAIEIEWIYLSTDLQSSKHAYLLGAIYDSKHAYLAGSSLPGTDSKHAYLTGQIQVSSSEKHSYLRGRSNAIAHKDSYLSGVTGSQSSKHSYTRARSTSSSSKFAYISSGVKANKKAYSKGITTTTGVLHAFLFGWVFTGDNTITLINSNETLMKDFRVLKEGYDDGTYNRIENIQRTISGSYDLNIGAVYRTWSLIIRVRLNESVSGYGNRADLETFYSYNKPSGTPSNRILMIDHHQNSIYIHIIGSMQKALLGCQIEGNEAWYIYKLEFMEAPVAA